MVNENFLSQEIRFQCQGTGRCCVSRGSYGYVYLTLSDRQRIARHLKIPTQTFTRGYCDKTDGHFHLKEFSGPCRFLQTKACTIYDARPAQCRTWPFWPENMNALTWNNEVKTFCPGIGKGRRYSSAEIIEILQQDPVDPYKPLKENQASIAVKRPKEPTRIRTTPKSRN